MPICAISDFRDVVQIMEGLLRINSNLIVVVCYLLNFLYIWRRVKEGVEGSERVSDSDKDVSDERSIGSLTKIGSPRGKTCVTQ